MTISGISGPGNLTTGSIGTVVLSSANTYTGTTTVQSGILRIQNGRAGCPATRSPWAQRSEHGHAGAGASPWAAGASLNGVGFGSSGGSAAGPWSTRPAATPGPAPSRSTARSADFPPSTADRRDRHLGYPDRRSERDHASSRAVNSSDLTKVAAGPWRCSTSTATPRHHGAGRQPHAVQQHHHGGRRHHGCRLGDQRRHQHSQLHHHRVSAGSLTINLFGTLGTSAVSIGQRQCHARQQRPQPAALTNSTGPNVTFNTGSLRSLPTTPRAASATVGTVTLNGGQSTINSGYTAVPWRQLALTFTNLVRAPGPRSASSAARERRRWV